MSKVNPRHQRAVALALIVVMIGGLVAIGLILRSHGPGNMGTGFLGGALVAALGALIMGWRMARHPERTTTLERGWAQSGDERDDAVLTRALAVLGLLALPVTGAAGIIIALGVNAQMVLALLLFAQIGIFFVAFAVINRRS